MRALEKGQSALLLLDVIDVLKGFKVPYVVIGAMAASFYGVVRASMDADCLVVLDDARIADDVIEALKKQKLNVVCRKGAMDDPLKGVIVVEDIYQNRVDLILGIKGFCLDAFNRTNQTFFEGQNIEMIGCEDLIAMKVFAGGAKDIGDVKGMLAVSKEELNEELLMSLAAGYGKQVVSSLKEILLNNS